MTTFADTMAKIVIKLDEREIYNDIRSTIDITEQTETPGDSTPAEYQEVEVYQDGARRATVGAYGTLEAPFTANPGHTNITWLRAYISDATRSMEYGLSKSECEARGGTWYGSTESYYSSACYYPDIRGMISIRFKTWGKTTAIAKITNPYNYEITTYPKAVYQYLTQEAWQGPAIIETETRTLTVRAIDDTSIAKYGRRVMNLTWPLGQTQTQMQSLVNGYRDRYKEPIVTATVRIQGSTDALVEQILTRKISDRITINHTILAMSANFFINSVDTTHDSGGLLEATWQLEQVRDMEAGSIFTLDISALDGPDILGW